MAEHRCAPGTAPKHGSVIMKPPGCFGHTFYQIALYLFSEMTETQQHENPALEASALLSENVQTYNLSCGKR